jgi:hypothetical protein
MSKPVSLIEAMDLALEKIRQQPADEYIKQVKSHQNSPIAVAMRDLGVSPSEVINTP